MHIAVAGNIGSGKTTSLLLFKDLGCDVISSDEVVKKLYQDERVISKINKMFKLSFTNEVDKNDLRDYILTHMKDKRRLENLIHPLVKKEVTKFMNNSTAPIRVVEVPLLFKAHYEDGNVPCNVIYVEKLDAKTLGYLFYFFMRACAMSAYMLDINPFNQPGVEVYKKNMFHLLGKKGY